MNRRAGALLAALLLTLALAACGGGSTTQTATESGAGPVRVAASMSVFADMVRQVGGERVTVLSLIPPGADAHTFQPAPKDVKRLSDVRAVFINGAHLEESLMGVLENNLASGARLVELSAGLQPIAVEQQAVGSAPAEAAGEDHAAEDEGNPHFWLDVRYAKQYVERIRETLTAVDGDGQAVYQSNAGRYLAELDQLDREIRAQIERIPAQQRRLVTFHDAFPYFARAYGLELAGYVIRAPGREPSAQEIRALVDILKRQNVKTVFKEPQLNARLLERAAKDAGVRVDLLYSDALTGDITSYVEMMRRNAANVTKGLQ